MKKINIFAILMLIILIACSESNNTNYNEDYNKISSLPNKQAIALDNSWKFSKKEIKSHITSRQLIVNFPDDREVIIELSDSKMNVAIAPFINKTHPCNTHYLSSCDGELKNQSFDITINEKSGISIYEGSIQTMANGFFELWLPRNKEISMNINYDKLT